MNIVFAVDRAYLPYCATAAISICYNLQAKCFVHFHILHGGDIDQSDIQEFVNNFSQYRSCAQFTFHQVDDRYQFGNRVKTTEYIPEVTYYRLYIHEILSDINKVLYLDADIAVCSDITELYSQDIAGFCLAGVEDVRSKLRIQRLFLPESSKYVNGGVLLMNLDKMRQSRMTQNLEGLLQDNRRALITSGDQDILALLFHDKTKYLDMRWNVYSFGRKWVLDTFCSVDNSFSKEQQQLAFNFPHLIHYIGETKPWHAQPQPDPVLALQWFAYAKMVAYFSSEEFEKKEAAVRKAANSYIASTATNAVSSDNSWHNKNLVALKNLYYAYHAQSAAPERFDLADISLGPEHKVAVDTEPEQLAVGNPFDTLRLLFGTPDVTVADNPGSIDRADVLVFTCFSDTSRLIEQVYMLSGVVNLRKRACYVRPGAIAAIAHPVFSKKAPLRFKRIYSYIIDDLSFYDDSYIESRFLRNINGPKSLNALSRKELESCHDFIVDHRISQYNFGLLAVPEQYNRLGPSCVLVVDQPVTDAGTRSGAKARVFKRMLQAALAENPQSHVLLYSPPSMADFPYNSYYSWIKNTDRITRIKEIINPYSIFALVKKVYVCSSLVGFEALLAGKEVCVFGNPFYAGRGLTADYADEPRLLQRNTCSLEELFTAIYCKHSIFIDPYTGEHCRLPGFLSAMVRLRDEFFGSDTPVRNSQLQREPEHPYEYSSGDQ